MKRIIAVLLALTMVMSMCGFVKNVNNARKNEAETENADADKMNFDAKSVVLMEASSGKILYSENKNKAYSPASVTKIMTLLLAAQAYSEGAFSLEDNVTISRAASEMGGSQVFLEEGESITVEELFRCAVIASANDAAVALAELVSGSEELFVKKMNAKAMELGLSSTNFENATGLDDDTKNHVTSAEDIAIMSRELLKFDFIKEYSSKWQDSIRDGEFILTNTNRLVRFYDGCTGLKTGSTDKAGYCISATAKRGNMELIAVVMGAPSRDIRNNIARTLLDVGFSSYSLYEREREYFDDATVLNGTQDKVSLYAEKFSCVIPKNMQDKVEIKYNVPAEIEAPVLSGNKLGEVEYILDGEKLGVSSVFADTDVPKITYFGLFWKMLLSFMGISE